MKYFYMKLWDILSEIFLILGRYFCRSFLSTSGPWYYIEDQITIGIGSRLDYKLKYSCSASICVMLINRVIFTHELGAGYGYDEAIDQFCQVSFKKYWFGYWWSKMEVVVLYKFGVGYGLVTLLLAVMSVYVLFWFNLIFNIAMPYSILSFIN